jgi:hypothetical protein
LPPARGEGVACPGVEPVSCMVELGLKVAGVQNLDAKSRRTLTPPMALCKALI